MKEFLQYHRHNKGILLLFCASYSIPPPPPSHPPPPSCLRESLGFISRDSFLWGLSLLGTINHTILLPPLICVHCQVVWVTVIETGESGDNSSVCSVITAVCAACSCRASVFYRDGSALGCRSLFHPFKLDCKQ